MPFSTSLSADSTIHVWQFLSVILVPAGTVVVSCAWIDIPHQLALSGLAPLLVTCQGRTRPDEIDIGDMLTSDTEVSVLPGTAALNALFSKPQTG